MFVKLTPSKVKFVDHQLDDYVLENSVLKSKLHSKMEALSIMGKELDKCSMERDRYRLLVQQMRSKHPLGAGAGAEEGRAATRGVSGGEMLATTRDQNNQLKLEVESLRSRCEEATRDVEALRRQLRLAGDAGRGTSHRHEELVLMLETLNGKHQQLQQQLGAALDEKEELTVDRDYYKSKVLRLNQQVCYALAGGGAEPSADRPTSAQPPVLLDVDAVLTENKYLQERLTQMQVEKEIVKQTLVKYKNVLENRNKKASLNFNDGNLDVMTQQQVRIFLEKRSSRHGTRKGYVSELRALCLGLFESLNDKSIALQHQRKTNRILANRISELEKTLESWSNGEKYIPIFPSQMLLEEFCPDSELAQNRLESEKPEIAPKSEATKSESDEEVMKSEGHSCHIEVKSSCSDDTRSDESGSTRSCKTVLPPELEELVREALEQMRP